MFVVDYVVYMKNGKTLIRFAISSSIIQKAKYIRAQIF